jgi:hypothetical protein
MTSLPPPPPPLLLLLAAMMPYTPGALRRSAPHWHTSPGCCCCCCGGVCCHPVDPTDGPLPPNRRAVAPPAINQEEASNAASSSAARWMDVHEGTITVSPAPKPESKGDSAHSKYGCVSLSLFLVSVTNVQYAFGTPVQCPPSQHTCAISQVSGFRVSTNPKP